MPLSDEPLLSSAEDLPSELRLGLERLKAKRPGPERLAAMAAAVGVSVTTGSSTATSNAAGGGSALTPPAQVSGHAATVASPALKLLIVGGIVGAGAAALFLLRSPAREAGSVLAPAPVVRASADTARVPAPEPNTRSTQRPDARPSGPLPAEPPTPLGSFSTTDDAKPPARERPDGAETPSEASAQTAGQQQKSVARATSAETENTSPSARTAREPNGVRAPAPVPGHTGTSAKASEAELLRDARQVLDRSPLVALSLCEEHRQNYPSGGLSQERELIAIAALLRLGRTSSAEDRAARFRAAYPRSPHLARLDRLVPP
jgi:hypothetical protein